MPLRRIETLESLSLSLVDQYIIRVALIIARPRSVLGYGPMAANYVFFSNDSAKSDASCFVWRYIYGTTL